MFVPPNCLIPESIPFRNDSGTERSYPGPMHDPEEICIAVKVRIRLRETKPLKTYFNTSVRNVELPRIESASTDQNLINVAMQMYAQFSKFTADAAYLWCSKYFDG